MNLVHVLILGVVEGLTEFLPVSSTGHLILAERLMGILQTEFVKSFTVAIQLGAILSVVILYWRKLFLDRDVILRLLSAFIPTAVIGLALYKTIKRFFLGNALLVVAMLFVGGLFLIIFEKFYQKKQSHVSGLSAITFKQAILIGVFQALAVVPGVSRSAATIIGGMLLGLQRKTIVEFSFLLAVPTMFAATIFDLMKSAYAFSSQEFILLAFGFAMSFVMATISIKFFLYYIKNNTFVSFGIYRILIAVVFGLLVL